MLKQMPSCHPITENMHVHNSPQLNRCDPVIYALLLDRHCDLFWHKIIDRTSLNQNKRPIQSSCSFKVMVF